MTRNRKLITAVAAVIALVLTPVAAVASTSSPSASNRPVVIHLVEHAITDTVQEFHPPKESLGDVLGWHNPVYNASNTQRIASDNGYCIRTVATGKTEWECAWTTLLPGGQITVEGPYYDDGTNTTLAIIGIRARHLDDQPSKTQAIAMSPVGTHSPEKAPQAWRVTGQRMTHVMGGS
jgi:allene oxide cyclase